MIAYSLEAEMSALGAMIVGAVDEVRAVVKADDFYRPAHRLIFRALCNLKSVDLVMLKNELVSRGELEECGGEDYLIQVAEFMPMRANAACYAEVVRDWSEIRATIAAAEKVIQVCRTPDTSLEEIRAARASLTEVEGGSVPFQDFASVAIRTERRRGVSTGFPSLDDAISTGGFPCGQMTIVSAYQKTGKTSLMLSSFVKTLERGGRALFASFADLGREDLKERIVRNLCGWSKEPYVSWEQENFHNAVNSVVPGHLFCYDASQLDSGDDIETFTAWFKAQHKKTPFETVFMDYAQKITTSDKRATSDLSAAATCSRKICKLAASTGTAFVVGAQITEGNQKDGRKTITKGARSWEEDCGWCLRITDEKEVEVAYSRFGKQGFTVPMVWNDVNLRFEESDPFPA